MFSSLYSALVLLAQNNADGDGGAAQTKDGGAADGNPGAANGEPVGLFETLFSNPMMPAMVGIMILFYFMFMRPQSKARREQQDKLKSLKKNDKVVTIGGIHGVVVGLQSDGQEVVIRVDENTGAKIKMSRAAIHEIMRDGGNKDGTKGDSADK
ncbi:MAG: preprotein translocase subunit YajC [Pirellulales bacterium]|nr:preprotein translocase subunit YajC [Pirellulales bacterium]